MKRKRGNVGGGSWSGADSFLPVLDEFVDCDATKCMVEGRAVQE